MPATGRKGKYKGRGGAINPARPGISSRKKIIRAPAPPRHAARPAARPHRARALYLMVIILIIGAVALLLGTQTARFFDPTVPAGEVPPACHFPALNQQPPCCAVPPAGMGCGNNVCEPEIGGTATN